MKYYPDKINFPVCIAGLGGLGSIVSYYLAGLGIRKIVLIDKDIVEKKNLNRQILYEEKDVGRRKVDVAYERLKSFNSKIQVYKIFDDVKNLEKYEIIKECKYIFDCLDNWRGKILLDKLSHKINSVLIHGGVEGERGQVYVHIPGKNPCINKIFKIKNDKKDIEVFPSTCGIVGSLMVQIFNLYRKRKEVWKYLYVFNKDSVLKYKIKL